ncbi:hypothetical protein WN944_007257 [Citrus x changshan-huyou]|uniref:Uncharacterized protein n=1 Tax=Citrus x changshan-huyou TaxID=2935761 RepID=A0AAP0MKN4_9ROSI
MVRPAQPLCGTLVWILLFQYGFFTSVSCNFSYWCLLVSGSVKVPRFCVRASLDTNVSDMSVNGKFLFFLFDLI